MYRIFISTPGDLQREQDICRAVIGNVNEKEARPLKILLVSVGLLDDGQIVAFRSAVSENVRQCTFYLQVFEDSWGPDKLFRKTFFLGLECRDDAGMPMREAVVFLKDAPHETDTEILAFRKELEERQDVRVFRFDTAESLTAQLEGVCSGWVRAIVDAGGGVPD